MLLVPEGHNFQIPPILPSSVLLRCIAQNFAAASALPSSFLLPWTQYDSAGSSHIPSTKCHYCATATSVTKAFQSHATGQGGTSGKAVSSQTGLRAATSVQKYAGQVNYTVTVKAYLEDRWKIGKWCDYQDPT